MLGIAVHNISFLLYMVIEVVARPAKMEKAPSTGRPRRPVVPPVPGQFLLHWRASSGRRDGEKRNRINIVYSINCFLIGTLASKAQPPRKTTSRCWTNNPRAREDRKSKGKEEGLSLRFSTMTRALDSFVRHIVELEPCAKGCRCGCQPIECVT